MTSRTQNVPVPYTQRVLERVQQNWKDRKVEILAGGALSVLGLALIPVLGPFSAIICSVGLAVLGHGFLRDCKRKVSLPQSVAPLVRIKKSFPNQTSSKGPALGVATAGALLGASAWALAPRNRTRERRPESDPLLRENPPQATLPPSSLRDASGYTQIIPELSLKKNLPPASKQMFGFTRSDLSMLLFSLKGKEIPSQLSPILTLMESLLNNRFSSSHPLILMTFDPKEIDCFQSLMEKGPLPLSHSEQEAGEAGLIPLQKEEPINEVILLCKPEECRRLNLLLNRREHFLEKSQDSETLSIIRLTPEELLGLFEESANHPDLPILSLLYEFFMPERPSPNPPSQNLNAEEFQSITALLTSENEKVKAKNEELGKRLLALSQDASAIHPLSPFSNRNLLTEAVNSSQTNGVVGQSHNNSIVAGYLTQNIESNSEALQTSSAEDFLAISALITSENEKVKNTNEKLGNPLFRRKPTIAKTNSSSYFDIKHTQTVPELSLKKILPPVSRQMFGFTRSDLSMLLFSLKGKEIPSQLSPILTLMESLLNNRFSSSHPLILMTFDPKEIDCFQSLMEKGPLPLSHSEQEAGEAGLIPLQKEEPINEVILLCKPEECRRLNLLLNRREHFLEKSQDSETLSIIRLTPEELLGLVEESANHPDLPILSLLYEFFMPERPSPNPPSQNLNAEEFQSITALLTSENEKVKAKNEELGKRLLALSQEDPDASAVHFSEKSDLTQRIESKSPGFREEFFKPTFSSHSLLTDGVVEQSHNNTVDSDYLNNIKNDLLFSIYRNNFKNQELEKKAPQNFSSVRESFASRQDVSESENFEVKRTIAETDSLNYCDIKQQNISQKELVWTELNSLSPEDLRSESIPSDLSFQIAVDPTTVTILSIALTTFLLPFFSCYFLSKSAPPRRAIPLAPPEPLLIAEPGSGCSRVASAAITALSLGGLYYATQDRIPDEKALYIDPRSDSLESDSLWEAKPLQLYCPNGNLPQKIEVLEKVDQPSAALTLRAEQNWASQIMGGLWKVAKTGAEMGVAHIQNQPSELQREMMIYRTASKPIDLAARLFLAKMEEGILHTASFLWEMGQPIVYFTNAVLIPLASYSYLFIKAASIVLFDLSKTAAIWLAEKFYEFILWASAPHPISEEKPTLDPSIKEPSPSLLPTAQEAHSPKFEALQKSIENQSASFDLLKFIRELEKIDSEVGGRNHAQENPSDFLVQQSAAQEHGASEGEKSETTTTLRDPDLSNKRDSLQPETLQEPLEGKKDLDFFNFIRESKKINSEVGTRNHALGNKSFYGEGLENRLSLQGNSSDFLTQQSGSTQEQAAAERKKSETTPTLGDLVFSNKIDSLQSEISEELLEDEEGLDFFNFIGEFEKINREVEAENHALGNRSSLSI